MYSADGRINEKHLAGNHHHPSNVGGQQAWSLTTSLCLEVPVVLYQTSHHQNLHWWNFLDKAICSLA